MKNDEEIIKSAHAEACAAPSSGRMDVWRAAYDAALIRLAREDEREECAKVADRSNHRGVAALIRERVNK